MSHSSGKLRILFITPYVPSPVRVRPYAFIRELAKMGHEVTLACLVQPVWEAQYLPEIEPYCRAVYPTFPSRLEPLLRTLTSLPTRMPLSVAFSRSEPFEQLIRYLNGQERFDLVHTEFLRAVPATAFLVGGPKVYDAVDSLALAYRRSLSAAHVSVRQRFISLVEWLKIRGYEQGLLARYDQIMVSSPADCESLSQNGKNQVLVVPNGVDVDYFTPSERSSQRTRETIVFLGKMSYYVNVASVLWFYRKVLPLIRREHPGVRFQIVGRNPTRQIINLANDPGVEVTGTVDDVRPYLAAATVSVCPMVSGSGIQNKLLEAMAMGTPCVATTLACQALQAEVGRDVLSADTAEGFAASILALLDAPLLRQRLGDNGRRYVENFHTWERIGLRLEGLYTGLVH